MDPAFGARDSSIADHCTIGDAYLSGKNHAMTKTRAPCDTHL